MTIDRLNFGQAVARRRRAAGLLQRELAELAGVPRSTIAGVEVGAGLPDLHTAAALANALRVTLDELIGEVCHGPLD